MENLIIEPQNSVISTRLEFHQRCEKSKKSRAYALELFRNDIVTFFESCLWTYDPRVKPSDQPFNPYEFQKEYIQKVNQHIIDEVSLLKASLSILV